MAEQLKKRLWRFRSYALRTYAKFPCSNFPSRSSIAKWIRSCKNLRSRITGVRPTIGFSGPDVAALEGRQVIAAKGHCFVQRLNQCAVTAAPLEVAAA